ncbi:uncharacterized protein LOC120533724 [Polypterus senegalus]|uniref:uncharacterized protein LOC120533724 n=1 Tax=Polypterus senegalus TaxID=55291 RepID=UPI0019653340|nr:uncharacterized protein LOC120533724 [Polypterus senegalus]
MDIDNVEATFNFDLPKPLLIVHFMKRTSLPGFATKQRPEKCVSVLIKNHRRFHALTTLLVLRIQTLPLPVNQKLPLLMTTLPLPTIQNMPSDDITSSSAPQDSTLNLHHFQNPTSSCLLHISARKLYTSHQFCCELESVKTYLPYLFARLTSTWGRIPKSLCSFLVFFHTFIFFIVVPLYAASYFIILYFFFFYLSCILC